MNKKANRRAFFVCLFIGLMYASVAFRLPGKNEHSAGIKWRKDNAE